MDESAGDPYVSVLIVSSGDEPLGRRFRKLSLGQYDNNAGGQPAFSRCGWVSTTGAEQTPSLAAFLSPAEAKEVGPPPWSPATALSQIEVPLLPYPRLTGVVFP